MSFNRSTAYIFIVIFLIDLILYLNSEKNKKFFYPERVGVEILTLKTVSLHCRYG